MRSICSTRSCAARNDAFYRCQSSVETRRTPSTRRPHTHQQDTQATVTRTWPTRCVTVVQGHPRSSKRIPIESPYVISYQTSIVHCNYAPIFYLFRDITTYWSKICVFAVLATPVSLEAIAREVPWELWYESWYPKIELLARWWKPHGSTVIISDTTSVWQTDRRTDGHAAHS